MSSHIIVQISDILRFFEPPYGGSGATYTVHIRLTGKPAVHFPFVLMEIFALGVTTEEL